MGIQTCRGHHGFHETTCVFATCHEMWYTVILYVLSCITKSQYKKTFTIYFVSEQGYTLSAIGYLGNFLQSLAILTFVSAPPRPPDIQMFVVAIVILFATATAGPPGPPKPPGPPSTFCQICNDVPGCHKCDVFQTYEECAAEWEECGTRHLS